MFYTIYKITNKINNKIYIGKHQTKNLNDGYMGSGKHLRYAIQKYGIENFEKEILFQFDNEAEMNAKEEELVTDEFCLREDTYNLCPGGKGGWGYVNTSGIDKFKGKNHSDNSRKRMGHIGNTFWLGKEHSEVTKEKIGENARLKLTGKKRPVETKEKISKTLKEKYHNKSFIIEIIEYSKENSLSIRQTCKMFGLNRITYTKYYKEYAGVAQG